MKLVHILEYEFPKIRFQHKRRLPYQYYHERGSVGGVDGERTDWTGEDPSIVKRRKTQHVGSGVFSSTYGHKDRPHDVRKISRRQKVREVDGYYHLLHALEHSEENTNPYFPRFRDIKVYRTPPRQADPDSNQVVYSVNMERLFPLTDLRPEEFIAGLTKIFGTKNLPYALEFLNVKETEMTSVEIAWIFESAVQGSHSGFDLNKVVDKDFIKAIMFIRQIEDNKDLNVDIHDENIMYRRGPGGVQFVITDPFST